MKKHFILVAVIGVLIAVGCSSPYSENIDGPIREDNKKAKEVIITATFDNQSDAQTKTVLNAEGKVEWLPADEIVIFSDGESAKFTSINTENARKANFRGTISFVTGATEGSDPDAFVYGLYPYDANATATGGVITTTIPTAQIGLAGSFADDLALAVAKSVSTNLSFKNAYSGIDFEFSEEGYETVTLSSNNGEPIAGAVTISFGSDGVPVTTVDANGSSSITLTAPGGGTFETEKRYYIVCAPQTLNGGYTLTAEKSTGRAVFERASKKEFKRNVLTDVSGYLNERGTFESLNITFADANVKAICVAQATGWDTNGDGELSYTEAAAVTAIPCSVFGGNTTITSFDEFQYFINVTSIEDSAFDYCTSLTSIEIPKNVTNIGSYAFSQSALTSIFIPANVTNIVAWAFSGCSALIDISVSEDNPRYESRGGCNAIIDKTFNQLDVGCRTTIIPNDVELIRTAAFYGCLGLTSITIPASIKWIGTGAFEGCSNLESIIMHPTTPPTQDYSFEGSTCPIYVSQECYEEYKTNWSTYQARIQAVPVEAVDLGLSVKWGNRNQYAVNPSAFGRYFTFAEAISAYGSGEWRLPTKAEIQELLDNCTMTRETDGFLFTATNGNSIFMPTAGCYLSDTYYPPLPYGGASYWTSYQAGNQKSRLKWWDETHTEAGPMLEDGEFQNYKFSVRLVKP